MLDFILNGIFWVLALYGLFEIIKISYIFLHIQNLNQMVFML